MSFPTMGRSRRARINIPELRGGVNYREAMNVVEDNQLTDVENMWYQDGMLRTRPGLKIPHRWPNRYAYSDMRTNTCTGVAVAQSSGCTHILTVESNNGCCWVDSFSESGYWDCTSFCNGSYASICEFDNVIGGEHYDALLYTGSGQEKTVYGVNAGGLKALETYAPIVMVNGLGNVASGSEVASGTLVEGYSLLTGRYRAWFNTDAESKKYYLPQKIYALGSNTGAVKIAFTNTQDTSDVEWIWELTAEQVASGDYVGVASGDTTVKARAVKGTYAIEFDNPLPAVEGASNNLKVTVFYERTDTVLWGMDGWQQPPFAWFGGTRSGIHGGTRLFMGGDYNRKNRLYWSNVDNPLYFSENNYVDVGNTESRITAFGKQSDMLVIFKEREIYYTTYVAGAEYTAEDVIDGRVVDISTLAATFPVTQLSGNIGCDLPNTVQLMQNRLIWADKGGKVWSLVYSSEYSTRNIRSIGGMVERRFKEVLNNATMAAAYGDYYLLISGGTAFVLDTADYGYTHYTSYGNDQSAQRKMAWYRWELPVIDDDVISGFFASAQYGTNCLLFTRAVHGTDEMMMCMQFGDGADETTDFEGNYSEIPIHSMFQTKLFDMGYPEKVKMFDRLHIGFGKTENLEATVTYVTEKGNFEDSYIVTAESTEDMFTASFVDTQTLTPNIRCRRFAVRVENEGEMYVDGLGLSYKI